MIELEVDVLLKNFESDNSFILVLKEIAGNRKIPVVIGAYEAQAISLVVKEIGSYRPMTHDLFVKLINLNNIQLKQVVIDYYANGIFTSNIELVTNEGDTQCLDARTSDAVALALRAKAKIYVTEEVMNQVVLNYKDEDVYANSAEYIPNVIVSQDISTMSKDELEINMQIAIAREDYALASKYRDERNRRF